MAGASPLALSLRICAVRGRCVLAHTGIGGRATAYGPDVDGSVCAGEGAARLAGTFTREKGLHQIHQHGALRYESVRHKAFLALGYKFVHYFLQAMGLDPGKDFVRVL